MSKGEMAYLALVILAVLSFMISLIYVSIWSSRGRKQ